MSTFNSIKSRLEVIKGLMDLSEAELTLLENHAQVSHAELEVDGEKYPAWRIVHNRALGPGKGGIRFHPEVSEDEVRSLSFWMSIKNSLLGLPYGGGKGGVKVNPKEKSQEELEKISRAFVQAFHPVLGQDKDVPAPDVYTNPQVMAWMLDEYEKQVGYHEPGMITGKPLELGGIALRGDATARGGFIVTSEFVKKLGLNKAEVKVAVQGFGNAGHFVAQMLHKDGYKVVAVSDSRGGIFNENGLDIPRLSEFKAKGNAVSSWEEGTVLEGQSILETEVDLLVLAALENQITEENANNIKAKYIVELANGPITPEADKILFEKEVHVVPDILANAGGVVGSYFEWAQNRAGGVLDEEYLKSKLEQMMKKSWNGVYQMHEEFDKKVDFRTAAYMIAIKRILGAEKLRGNLK